MSRETTGRRTGRSPSLRLTSETAAESIPGNEAAILHPSIAGVGIVVPSDRRLTAAISWHAGR